VLALTGLAEKWVLPMSRFLKAKAKYFLGAKPEAKALLIEAQNSNGSEFVDLIQSRIEWLKRRVER
ncbi:MAG: hypothetical protein CVV24_15105, partial [Ignavibacteriae bacterium HGW-Ignavibacteriae-3]